MLMHKVIKFRVALDRDEYKPPKRRMLDNKTEHTNNHNEELHKSLEKGHYREINKHLQDGNMPCTEDGVNCFIMARHSGQWDIVKKLLNVNKEGANAKDSDGKTILMFEVQNISNFNYLLEVGANPNLIAFNGDNLLIIAAKENAPLQVIQKIIELGIDVNATNRKGASPLLCLMNKYEVDSHRFSINRFAHTADGCSAGTNFRSIFEDYKAKVTLLLESGANTSIQDSDGKTALLYAAAATEHNEDGNAFHFIKLFIDLSVDPNLVDCHGKSALLYVMDHLLEKGNIEKIKYLLELGVDVLATDVKGNTSLIYLCESYLTVRSYVKEVQKIIQSLVQGGVNVNASNKLGITALMYVLQNFTDTRDLKVISTLLDAGADPDIPDKNGNTALMCASKMKFENTCKKTTLKVYKKLLTYTKNLNAANEEGKTALHLVIENFNNVNGIAKVMALIRSGANITAQDKNGRTPLMESLYLIQPFDSQLMALLLSNNSLLVQDTLGQTALHHLFIAFRSTRLNEVRSVEDLATFLGIVDVMLKSGGNIFALDHKNESPLSLNFKLMVFNHSSDNKMVVDLVKILLQHPSNIPCDEIPSATHPLNLLARFVKFLNDDENNAYLTELFAFIMESPYKSTSITSSGWLRGDMLCGYKDSLGWTRFEEPAVLDMIGNFIVHTTKRNIVFWIEKLASNGFPIISSNPNVVSPLTALFLCHDRYEPQIFTELTQFFIEEGVDRSQSLLHFNNRSGVDDLYLTLKVPDALWLAAKLGDMELVRSLLPYWNVHPLALMLYFDFVLAEDEPEDNDHDNLGIVQLVVNNKTMKMKRNVNALFPLLLEVGGPLPHGTIIYQRLERLLLKLRNSLLNTVNRNCRRPQNIETQNLFSFGRRCNHRDCRSVQRAELEDNIYTPIKPELAQADSLYKTFSIIHREVPSLKHLSRCALRASMVPGNDLPKRLSAILPPGFNLRSYVSYTEQI